MVVCRNVVVRRNLESFNKSIDTVYGQRERTARPKSLLGDFILIRSGIGL
jgi:hypothetical protein